MTPLAVSKVSTEINREQGVGAVVDRVTWTTPRIAPRAVSPELVKGRLTELVTPEAIVKGVAVPIIAPAALTNEALPVQDAAVPLDDAVAVLVRLIRAVSVIASPTGGKLSVRVVVAAVCASASPAAQLTKVVSINNRL